MTFDRMGGFITPVAASILVRKILAPRKKKTPVPVVVIPYCGASFEIVPFELLVSEGKVGSGVKPYYGY